MLANNGRTVIDKSYIRNKTLKYGGGSGRSHPIDENREVILKPDVKDNWRFGI